MLNGDKDDAIEKMGEIKCIVERMTGINVIMGKDKS